MRHPPRRADRPGRVPRPCHRPRRGLDGGDRGRRVDPARGDAGRHRQTARRPSPEDPPRRDDRRRGQDPRQYRGRCLRPRRRGLGGAPARPANTTVVGVPARVVGTAGCDDPPARWTSSSPWMRSSMWERGSSRPPCGTACGGDVPVAIAAPRSTPPAENRQRDQIRDREAASLHAPHLREHQHPHPGHEDRATRPRCSSARSRSAWSRTTRRTATIPSCSAWPSSISTSRTSEARTACAPVNAK